MWRHRNLVRSLVVRNLTVKYQRSWVGLIWTLLGPLLTIVILTAVFTHVVRIPIEHYWAFLLSGFFVWHCFQQSVMGAASVYQEHSALARSVPFPSEILVCSSALTRLIEFLLELLLVLLVLVIFHFQRVPPSFCLLPVLILSLVLLTLGSMYPIASLSVLFHDVRNVLPVLVMFLFYLSPVFYNIEKIPEELRFCYQLNPIAGLLTLFHRVLYEGVFPSLSSIAAVFFTALALHWFGFLVFRRLRGVCVEMC